MEVAKGDGKFYSEHQLPRLRKRINIIIQRSDGRVHEASVSDLDFEKQCVIVEWIENGETKGKSIDFPDVFEFNPTLGPQTASGSSGNRNLHLDLGSATNGSELPDHNAGDGEESGGSSESDDGLVVTVPREADDFSLEPDTTPAVIRESINLPSVSGLPTVGRRPMSGKLAKPPQFTTAVANRRPTVAVAAQNGAADKVAVPAAAPKSTAAKRATQPGPSTAAHRQDSARDRKNNTDGVSPRPSLPGNQGEDCEVSVHWLIDWLVT